MKSTILVVEDEALVGLEIKEDLEQMGYAVPEVIESGEAVAEAVARYKPDLMLMDVRLCGDIDGVDAARLVKAEFDVPVIFLTAYSDDETLRRVAQVDPDGFILKPFNEPELSANIRIALSRAKNEGALRQERRHLESTAAEVNEALLGSLPRSDAAGQGYLVGGFLDPCLSGSGDLFGVFAAGEGKRAFYGLDVMGHGLFASILALSLRDALPIIALSPTGNALAPAEVLRALYRRNYSEGDRKQTFFTIAYGLLDEATGDYAVVRAGHTPVMRLETGGTLRAHCSKGAAVGLMRDAEVEETRGTLAPGERLLVLSDGLLEAFGGEGALDRDIDRIASFASGFCSSSLEEFVAAFRLRAKESSTRNGRTDDVSLLVIERHR